MKSIDRQNYTRPKAASLVCIIGVLFLCAAEAWAGTETVLYNFGGKPDGSGPSNGLVMDSQGNLYGPTETGGTFGYGCVYKLSPVNNTWQETVLHSFNSDGTDGIYPTGQLVIDAQGNLYGTTQNGGPYNQGTVFQLTPGSGETWTETILHVFDGRDGATPVGGVVLDGAGNIYGTTAYGGTGGTGVAYELRKTENRTWKEAILYNFQGGSDGSTPLSSLVFDSHHHLYGTAEDGGSGGGVVFEIVRSKTGWTEKVIHTFNGGSDGIFPATAPIMDSAGNLYGATPSGGARRVGSCLP